MLCILGTSDAHRLDVGSCPKVPKGNREEAINGSFSHKREEKRHSRQREQHVQRSWGRQVSIPGGKCGRSRESEESGVKLAWNNIGPSLGRAI